MTLAGCILLPPASQFSQGFPKGLLQPVPVLLPVCPRCFPKLQPKGEVQRQLQQTHFKGSAGCSSQYRPCLCSQAPSCTSLCPSPS